MYKKLAAVFAKKAPLAEIIPTVKQEVETDYYFQLLSDYGVTLNAPQKKAVKAVEGPVLLIAGAGSGKTTVLTTRIGYMIHTKNIDPSNILLVTFTKKASDEMIERLSRIPGINRSASRSVIAGTYHSICLRILRAEGYEFRVLASERRKHYIIKAILKRMGRHEDYSPETIINQISVWKNNMVRPQDINEESDVEKELREIYKRYESVKSKEKLLDFDDMLLETYYLFQFKPEVLKKYQNRFKYILCDEFQDTSKVQYEIINMLSEPDNNLCIVGDDAQTIYSYRGAAPSFMINFEKVYPNCKKVIMDINYRSGPSVVGLANSIISHNKNQIKKTLKVSNARDFDVFFAEPRDSDEEAEQIVKDIRIKRLAGLPLKDIAVLYRTHATGRAIFDKLLMADIPFVMYGKSNESFYQNTFIRPLLSLLRVSVNLMDVDSMIDAAPILYISRNEMQAEIDEVSFSNMSDTPKDLFIQVIKKIADKKSGFQQRSLLSKMECIKSLPKMTAPQAFNEIRKGTINYESQLEIDERKTLTIHKEIILEILDECEQAARGFNTIQSFLSFVDQVEEKNREMEELRNQPDIEAVRLMTIHASKGLEFETVYGIGWSDGILPHKSALDFRPKDDSSLSHLEAIEEERRLGYVCVSRAKQYLYLSSPKRHRNETCQPSRFLLEVMKKN